MNKIFLLLFVFIFSFSGNVNAQLNMNIFKKDGSIISIAVNEIDSINYSNRDLALVKTISASSITQTSATVGGEILNNGTSNITSRGVCWSNTPNPTTANNVKYSNTSSSLFSVNLTNLSSRSVYYVRAFAINASGTSYGQEIVFMTDFDELSYVGVYKGIHFIQDSILLGIIKTLDPNYVNGRLDTITITAGSNANDKIVDVYSTWYKTTFKVNLGSISGGNVAETPVNHLDIFGESSPSLEYKDLIMKSNSEVKFSGTSRFEFYSYLTFTLMIDGNQYPKFSSFPLESYFVK